MKISTGRRNNNDDRYKYALEDKNLLPILFSGLDGIKTPKILVSCTNGIYCDGANRVLNKCEVADKLKNISKVFIKPSINS